MSRHNRSVYRYTKPPQFVDLEFKPFPDPDPFQHAPMDTEKIVAIAEELKKDPYGPNDHVSMHSPIRKVDAALYFHRTHWSPIAGWHGGLELYCAMMYGDFNWNVENGTQARMIVEQLHEFAKRELRLSKYQQRGLMYFSNWPIEFKYGWTYWHAQGQVQLAADIAYRRMMYFVNTDEHKDPEPTISEPIRRKSKPIKGWR